MARGHEVRLPTVDAESRSSELGGADDELGPGLDVAVSLGGDGTMLRTVALVAAAGVPVLGVNVGQLGYLTEVEPAELFAALGKVLGGEHAIEERMMLDVSVEGGPHTLALNEAVLEKTPTGHTVRLSVAIDDEFFTTYAADGLIVATPTGLDRLLVLGPRPDRRPPTGRWCSRRCRRTCSSTARWCSRPRHRSASR